MPTPRNLAATLALAGTLAAAGPAAATIWGIKTCGSSPGVCGNVASDPPTTLFSFEESGGGVTEHGAVVAPGATGAAVEVVADGLAISSAGALFAYELDGSGSTLLSLSLGVTDVQGTRIGSALANREIRGAAFDTGGHLFALDAVSDELLQIDAGTGNVLSAIAIDGGGFDVQTGVDIAFRSDGRALIVDGNSFYAIDVGTGLLTSLFQETTPEIGAAVPFYAGITFSDGAAPDSLYAYEVNGTDDVYLYPVDGGFAPRSTVHPDVVPSYNAGRGDLAAIVTGAVPAPAPGPLALLAAALAVAGIARGGAARRR